MKSLGRPVCEQCGFLLQQCVCQWIPTLVTGLKVIVIQDPKEAKHAKNTVTLLRLALPAVECLSCDTVDLEKKLSALPLERWRLVFPNERSSPIEQIARREAEAIEGVILIDATWRKAKRLFLSTPLFHNMASIHFVNPPQGEYSIRKSPSLLALSTLEACGYTLEQLTGHDMQPLRDFMVSAQAYQWRQQPKAHKHG